MHEKEKTKRETIEKSMQGQKIRQRKLNAKKSSTKAKLKANL